MLVMSDKLVLQINELNKLIDKYENTNRNIYNILNQENYLWKDGHSVSFFNMVDEEKKRINLFFSSLKQYMSIIEGFAKECSLSAKKIQVKYEYQENIEGYFVNYTRVLDNILGLYNSVDVSSNPGLSKKIYYDKNKIVATKTKMVNIMTTYNDLFRKFKLFENRLGNSLSNFSLASMKGIVKKLKVLNSSTVAFLHISETQSNIKKLDMYIKTEYEFVESIKKVLRVILNCYNGRYNGLIESINNNILDSFYVVTLEHKENVNILSDVLNSYQRTVKINKNSFESIDKETEELL